MTIYSERRWMVNGSNTLKDTDVEAHNIIDALNTHGKELKAILDAYHADMANLHTEIKREIAKFKAEEEEKYIRKIVRDELKWHEYLKNKKKPNG